MRAHLPHGILVSAVMLLLLACSEDSSKANSLNLNSQSISRTTTLEATADSTKNTKEFIVQQSVDLKQFQQYYHLSTNSNRKPLYILQNSFFTDKPNITKFNEPVEFVSCDRLRELGRPYIEFVQLDIQEGTANAAFRYYAEGVEVTIKFVKLGNKWEIKESNLVEKSFAKEPCNK
jgi:hypothetical protein